MTKNPVSEFVLRKIARLDRNDDSYSKAACAKLRRAVGRPPQESPDCWEITLPGAPSVSNAQEVIHTALTLYALHRQGKDSSMHDGETGFGAAIAKLIEQDKSNEQAIRRRFNAISTSAEFTELAHHARGLIQLMRAKGITMDYGRFARDLSLFLNQYHPEYANAVRLRWGREFYMTEDIAPKNAQGAFPATQ